MKPLMNCKFSVTLVQYGSTSRPRIGMAKLHCHQRSGRLFFQPMNSGNSRMGQILAATANERATNAQLQRLAAAARNARAMRRTTSESLWPVAQNSMIASGDQA